MGEARGVVMKLLVGAPIWKRAWALPHWFYGVEVASSAVAIEPEYVFVADPRDRETVETIEKIADALHRSVYFSWVEEDVATTSERVWNAERYHRMVYLRNLLLERVRFLEPELFFSVDSDIFLSPLALHQAGAGLHLFDAIGSKTFLSKVGFEAPNFAFLSDGDGLHRYDATGLFAVDVVMAAVLMKPSAYNVDYEWHRHGEDIGWAKAAARAHLVLGWDGTVVNKHAMTPEMAIEVDARCGF